MGRVTVFEVPVEITLRGPMVRMVNYSDDFRIVSEISRHDLRKFIAVCTKVLDEADEAERDILTKFLPPD